MKTSLKALLLPLPVVLMSCGGGGGGNAPDPNPQPPVITESCTADSNTTAETNCQGTGPIALNASTTSNLQSGELAVYQVPSDTEVTLISNSGDADLFLYASEPDLSNLNPYTDDNRLCGSWYRFKEDHCTATSSSGDMFAVVIADEDANFTLSNTNDCSVSSVNQWVYRNMKDYYLYSNRVPNVDLSRYDNSSDLINDLRYETLDTFSGIRDSAQYTSYFEEGNEFGMGHGWRRDTNGDLRISFVHRQSPLGRAGVERGDIAVSLEGEALGTMSNERYYELTGTREEPRTSNWTFIDRDSGSTKNITATIGEYTMNSVLYSGAITIPNYDAKIGHLVFETFIQPSSQALDSFINRAISEGVTELILDLRYNGGGRSSVSRRFGSQIGGASLDGKLHSRFEHNSKYAQYDYEEKFYEASPSLGLNRLIVLTSNRTASASERLINSLKPYIDVVTIGDTTRGKAFRSSGRQFCGKTLSAMQTQGVNANGVSVSGGIPASCYAADDLSKDFKDVNEGMLSSALDYIQNGVCNTQPFAKREHTATHLQTHEAAFKENIGL